MRQHASYYLCFRRDNGSDKARNLWLRSHPGLTQTLIRANGKKGVRSYSPNSANSNILTIFITALLIYNITIQSNQWAWRENAGRVGTKSLTTQKQRSVALMADTVEPYIHNYVNRSHNSRPIDRGRKYARDRSRSTRPTISNPGLYLAT